MFTVLEEFIKIMPLELKIKSHGIFQQENRVG